MIAKVIVDADNKQVNKPFDYLIPDELIDLITVGSYIKVSFGARKVAAFVVGIGENSDRELKEVISLIDLNQVLTLELVLLGKQLAKQLITTQIKIYKTMLPSALNIKYRKYIIGDLREFNQYKINEKLYLDSLDNNLLKSLNTSIKKENLTVLVDLKQKVKKSYNQFYQLVTEDVQLTAKKQLEIFEFLKENGRTAKTELVDKAFSTSALKALVDKKIVKITKEEKYRYSFEKFENKNIILSQRQQKVLNDINKSRVNLLHGVTGSGKTEIYLKYISEIINQGKEAIFLVPEISLTYQFIKRFMGEFKDQVAVIHSGLTAGERYDEWRKIKENKVKCVIGARSAVFAPFENLGVIIIDEAHETTYKQDNNPRYNAIDVAKMRCSYHQCALILGTATPSLEDYALAKKEIYHLLTLKNRINNFSMPQIKVVDMPTKKLISKELERAIRERILKNEQVIILLNRRGFNTFLLCDDCRETIKCKYCDVTLTYHKKRNELVCHYCGYRLKTTVNKQIRCACGSDNLIYLGFGTERLLEELESLFREETILRLDQDTNKNKNIEKSLELFKSNKARILLGTQMIAKGLDFPNVTLVGVISIDSMLNRIDFRANEKTYQLLVQVAGRAGRGEKKGEVIIQTLNKDHFVLKEVIEGSYESFFKKEINLRKLGENPPYTFIDVIQVSSKKQVDAFKEAFRIMKYLNIKNVKILGPVVPYISKVNLKYRVNLLVKYKIANYLDKYYFNVYLNIDKNIGLIIDKSPLY